MKEHHGHRRYKVIAPDREVVELRAPALGVAHRQAYHDALLAGKSDAKKWLDPAVIVIPLSKPGGRKPKL